MIELFANSGDPDQMPCSAASDLGLRCLPVTLLGVSSLQWFKCSSAFMYLNMKFQNVYFLFVTILNTPRVGPPVRRMRTLSLNLL